MTGAIALRDATRADAAAIAAVHVVSWRDTFAGLAVPDAVRARNTPERRLAWWDDVLAAEERDVLVAAAGDAVAGFICGGPMPASIRGRPPIPGFDGYLDALYVLPQAHGRGIGRALLDGLARRLDERGLRSVALHVAQSNPAVRFYERLGARFLTAETLSFGIDEEVQLAYGWAAVRDAFSADRRR